MENEKEGENYYEDYKELIKVYNSIYFYEDEAISNKNIDPNFAPLDFYDNLALEEE